MKIKYSFIIPVKEINDYILESIPKILEIDRNDYEIIVYPNELPKTKFVWEKTRLIASGIKKEQRGPAYKRNLSIRDAKGEILIFIDDDAYPESDMLDRLDEAFAYEETLAVGGPAITPRHDSFKQKVSGAVFLSSLSGGFPERYAPIGEKRFVDDWPSVNLSMKKKVFEDIGGFDIKYWPGEDTKLCLDFVKLTGRKILYDPKVIVYHHRREGLLRHLKQVGTYGKHRGNFARNLPETSFRFKYFIPTFFVLYIIGIPFVLFLYAIYLEKLILIYLFGLVVYLLGLLKAGFDIYKYEKNIRLTFLAIYYIFCTHLVYGMQFAMGFILNKKNISQFR